jgi:DNA-binding NtrC family response regulator
LRLHRNSLMNVLVMGGDPATRLEIAEAFHRESPLHAGPLVAIDAVRDAGPLLAALRSWTSGTTATIPVSLAAAERGTLFIDGIEHLDTESQRRLRQLIDHGDESSAVRPGRFVAGFSEDPAAAVAMGVFSPALYDALDKVRIELPTQARGAA